MNSRQLFLRIRPASRSGGLALGLILLVPGRAVAHGAFPDSQVVLAPSSRPSELLLGTTFGLITSGDAGRSWAWSCHDSTAAWVPSLALAPSGRLFAATPGGLGFTDDGACSWVNVGGPLAGREAGLVLSDAQRPGRVLVVTRAASGGQLFLTRDNGATFGDPLLTLPPMAEATGLATADGDAQTLYASWAARPGAHPWLGRSTNGGADWERVDLEPRLGAWDASLWAVDPRDARHIFLRLSIDEGAGRTRAALASSDDGGQTFAMPIVVVGGRLTALLWRADGTMLVAGVREDPGSGRSDPIGFRSRDRAATFEPWWPGGRARGLAERGSQLFMAADNLVDGFAVATADGEDGPWRPLLKFSQVNAVKACVRAACRVECEEKAGLNLWDVGFCSRADAIDAGAVGEDAAAIDATAADAGRAGDAGATSARSGCACALAGRCGAPSSAPWFGLVLIAALARLGHRRAISCRARRRRSSGE